MTQGLFETLESTIGPGFTRTASVALDEHEYGVGRTMHASFAAILAGLERNAGDAGVMSEVARLVGDRGNDAGVLANSAVLLTAGGNPLLGDRLVTTLFGQRREIISQAIARASGVGHQAAHAMMPHAGALVLALLGKRLGAGVPPTNALAGLISSEKSPLARTVPGYLRALIASVREAGAKMPDATALAGGGSLAWLLLPLVLLVGLAWYLMSLDTGTGERRTASGEASAPPSSTSSSWGSRERERDSATWGNSQARDRESERDSRSSDARTAVREETQPAKPSSSWTWDREPARPTAPSTSTSPSSSSTWTAPVSEPAATRAPPLPGLVRVRLVSGAEIDVMPEGVELKVKDLVEDRWAMVDKTRWFDFDRIRFRTGSSDISLGSRVQLRNVAAIMAAYQSLRIKIGGYTDNVGDPQSNLRLSDERAKRVMSELIKLGVPSDRVEAEGYGDQHPIADNATPEGRAKNRRTAVSVRSK